MDIRASDRDPITRMRRSSAIKYRGAVPAGEIFQIDARWPTHVAGNRLIAVQTLRSARQPGIYDVSKMLAMRLNASDLLDCEIYFVA